MTMISYAQNFEDVMLNRIFGDIKNGFYIDVGANDPVIDSVTKHFYDNGWSGINIEPVEEHFQALLTQRPKDINLQLAVSLEEGELEFWESEVRGWSTASQESISLHEKNNEKGIIKKVKSTSLEKICEQYVNNEIHFLKIDVEGFEKSVIESNDWHKYRPWLVLVEATLPNSQIESYEDWETILLEADYRFVYADGLNRFYLAKEHDELAERLKYPPNVFDQFSLYSLHVKNAEVNHLIQQNQELMNQITAHQTNENNVTVEYEDYLAKLNEQHKIQLKSFENSYSMALSEVNNQHELQLKALSQSHQTLLNELSSQNVAQLKMMAEKNRLELTALNELHSEELKKLSEDYAAKLDVIKVESVEQQKPLQERIHKLENKIQQLMAECHKSEDYLQVEKNTNNLLRRELVGAKYQILVNRQLEDELQYVKSELNRIHRSNNLAHLKIKELEPKLMAAEAEVERIYREHQLAHVKAQEILPLQLELEKTRAQLVCLENSRSWKITKPLRKFKAIFSKDK